MGLAGGALGEPACAAREWERVVERVLQSRRSTKATMIVCAVVMMAMGNGCCE